MLNWDEIAIEKWNQKDFDMTLCYTFLWKPKWIIYCIPNIIFIENNYIFWYKLYQKKFVAPFISLLLTPSEQKLVEYSLHNQSLMFLRKLTLGRAALLSGVQSGALFLASARWAPFTKIGERERKSRSFLVLFLICLWNFF